MVDAISSQYSTNYYEPSVQNQGVSQSQAVMEENPNEKVDNVPKTENKSDKVQSPYEVAVEEAGLLRQLSAENLEALSKIKSDKLEDLANRHAQISEECWAKLETLKESIYTSEQAINEIMLEIEIKFLSLIAEENMILGKTDNNKADNTTDTSQTQMQNHGNRTIAIA